jgi:two-component system, NarL family, sensor histidine kinase UhpB
MTALPPSADANVASNGFFDGPHGGLLLALREAIVMIDAEQQIVAMNPAAEHLLGLTAGQALGTPLTRFIPPRWRDAHAQQVRDFAASAVAQRAMAHGRRVTVLRADGSTVLADIALSRIEMAEPGGVRTPLRTLYAATLHDSSGERALEEQLAALERRMRAIFELSPAAIWICQGDVLVYANRATARLFALDSVDELKGRPVWALLDAESHAPLRAAVQRVLGGQSLGSIVAGRLTRRDGELREVELALAALPDHGQRVLQMVVSDVTERRREAAELERSRQALRDLSASVVEAREQERRRIARELHDELGQRLTALKIDLANLAAARAPAGSDNAAAAADDAPVAAMQATLDDTLASVRRIASDLRPLMLDDLGLNAAIEWLARDTSRRIGIPVHTRLPLTEPALDQRVAIALYRMVQEALTNVARHAQAKSVEITLQVQEQQLVLTVTDDGIGFDEQALQRAGSFGLMGLRERAHLLGGQIEIGRRPRGGTRLTVRVPSHPQSPR